MRESNTVIVDKPFNSSSATNTQDSSGTRGSLGSQSGGMSVRQRWLMRAAWWLAVIFAVSMFVVAMPAHFNETRTVFPDGDHSFYQIGVSDVPYLEAIGVTLTAYAAWLNGFDVLFMLIHLVTVIFIFSVRPSDWRALLFSLVLLIHGVTYGQSLRSLYTVDQTYAVLLRVLESLYWSGAFLTLLLFPSGKFVPRATRWIALLWSIWIAARVFFPAVDPFLLPYPISLMPFFVIFGIGVLAQVYRYRQIKAVQDRRRIAYIVFAIAFGVGGFVLYHLLMALFPALSQPGTPRLYYNLIGIPILIFACMLLIPLFIAVSILRFKLYDINIVVNRALVYSPLTILLGVVYFASVLLISQIFQSVTGGQQSPIAIAGSTLLIAALFNPLRNRVQNIVDRGFAARSPVATFRKEMRRNESANGVRANFGIYEVYEQIGRGGMAEVYRGRHPSLNRTVAIKMLSTAQRQNEDNKRRFEREAQLVAALRHPNIVQVFDFGVVDDTFYMVMEYLKGDTLSHRIHTDKQLPIRDVLQVIRDIAAALDYAHENGLIHRDVKPSNIMLLPGTEGTGQTSRAVLMDFGVAKLNKGDSTVTNSGLVGTIDYMAPEQIVSEKTIDGRADVYALGVIAFEMLTGHKPYSADNPGAILLAHLQQPVPDPRVHIPSLDSETAYAIMVALSKSSAARYSTAGEFYKAIRMSNALVAV